jgi:hypothetical protein
MSRRRSTSSSHTQSNQIPGANCQKDQNIRLTSDLYRQTYHSLMDIDCNHENALENTQVSFQHSIPPPYLNNLKPFNSPISSPLRRPHSPTENDLSELDDFEHDPNIKMIYNNRKKKQK